MPLLVKNLPANARDIGLTPGSGRSPGEGKGNQLQHSYLGNLVIRGASWAIDHEVTKNQARLSTHKHTQKAELQYTEYIFKKAHFLFKIVYFSHN